MKILALNNLYPPHHAGTFDFHCQTVTDSLRMRGHSVLVLTSSHGLKNEERDGQTERRLRLNGVYGHPKISGVQEMRSHELHNNGVLMETLEAYQPEVVHVFSLLGLSKSLIFTLYNSRLPVAYDVFDHWLSEDVAQDPWLRFWNAPSLPLLEQPGRVALEMSGERGRLDSCAPTRMRKGYDRLPGLFGDAKTRAKVEPNSIAGFRFDRMYFCSQVLKNVTERAGFCVNHSEVIPPAITAPYLGEIKTTSAPVTKFLSVAPLVEESGVMTALQALKIVRNAKLPASLSVYGRGESSYIAKLRSFAISNQLPVEFLNVSNQGNDLPAVYKRHDVFLHTPEWDEPFPFVALQAMGCGLPVIGAASGGAGELLRHGENSLTYPPGNAAHLAARIQELQISPALRQQMAQSAQEEVVAKFNETVVMDQIENFLQVSQAQTN